MTLDIDELEAFPEKPDFQRANGAPMVLGRDGKRHRLSRPSSYGKVLDDESALTNWRIDRAALGVAHDAALQAQYVALMPDDKAGLTTLREKAISAGRGAEAADIGTALHAMSERFETDDEWTPPEPYLSSLIAYRDALGRLGLKSEVFEQACVNWEFRAAGTFDRSYITSRALLLPDGSTLPPGSRLIGDLKTGGRLDYSLPAYAAQMAIYAGAQWYDVIEDEHLFTPTINEKWAILVWMPANDPGKCELLWVNLEVGRVGCQLAQQIKEWRANWRKGVFSAQPVLLTPDEQLLDERRAQVAHMNELRDARKREMSALPTLKQRTHYHQERVKSIARSQEALRSLQLRWPAGVPTPKKGYRTHADADAVEPVLTAIEAQYQLPFVPDPRLRVRPLTSSEEPVTTIPIEGDSHVPQHQ